MMQENIPHLALPTTCADGSQTLVQQYLVLASLHPWGWLGHKSKNHQRKISVSKNKLNICEQNSDQERVNDLLTSLQVSSIQGEGRV